MAFTDDYASNASTTGSVAIGASATGTIELPEDADWFKAQLTAGTAYKFTLTGRSSPSGALGDGSGTAYLSLYAPSGELVSATGITTPTGATVISDVATVTGTFHLGVSELSRTGDGAYRLDMEYSNVDDDYAANASTAALLPIDGSETGTIEVPSDHDWFKTPLEVGQVYLVTLQGADSGGGTLGSGAATSQLGLYSPFGEFISSTTDGGPGGDPAMLYTPSVSANHYFAVSALADSGIGTYRITVQDNPTPAAAATGGADYLLGTAGDNVLAGLAGNDVINGASGTDVAQFAGARADYQVAHEGSVWRITDNVGSEGTDTLIGVERLQFSDASYGLVNPEPERVPDYNQDSGFLFDAVYYLLSNPELAATVPLGSALEHYLDSGASRHLNPNVWFDPDYYRAKWADLGALNLDDATLFMHYNLYGVWEGRSAGQMFDDFDGNRYLAENPDVAAYVDAHVGSFLGSRTNGAIAHFLIYGADEQRLAYDDGGALIDLGYVLN